MSLPNGEAMIRVRILSLIALLSAVSATSAEPKPTVTPLVQTVDLDVGGSQEVELGGKKVTVKLLDLKETRDELRGAVRVAEVTVEVNGKKVTLVSSNYRLPVTVGGVQIDSKQIANRVVIFGTIQAPCSDAARIWLG